MLRIYRRLPIPTKLAASILAMLIPLGALTFFMQMGFLYDINIGRMERIGTQCLREAFHIQHYLANHRSFSIIAELAPKKATLLELEAPDPAGEISRAMISLSNLIESAKDQPAAVADALGCMDLTRLQREVGWYLETGEAHAYIKASKAVGDLIAEIANCARLALDPALDSQMLARGAVNALPETSRIMASYQWIALQSIAMLPPGTVIVLPPGERQAILNDAAYFKNGLFRRLMSDSNVAMIEDANYYTYSPTLTLNYGSMLTFFQKSSNLLLEVIARVEKGMATPYELFNAASRTRSAGKTLFDAAMVELDILIQKRIDGYQRWRMFGTALSGIGFLAALALSYAASRSITRGLETVTSYSRLVAGGELDTNVDTDPLEPRLRSMIDNIQAMVGTLKDKISYLDGILQGLTVPCFVVDQDERIIFVSKPGLELIGMEDFPDEVIGQRLGYVAYGDKDWPTVARRCMNANRPIRDELIDVKTRTGGVKHVRADMAPLTDPAGNVNGAFVVATDLTMLLEKEQHIERLASFPREAPDPVLSANPDGDILFRNKAALAILEAEGLYHEKQFLPESHNEIVTASLKSGSARQGIETQTGSRVYSWTYQPLLNQNIVHIYATDISLRIKAEKQLLHETLHDTLTGLPNKMLFLDRVSQAFRRARSQTTRFSVLVFDLDGFKNVNDGLGHRIGDKLLARCAWRVAKCLNPDETLARLGGDEFALLLPIVSDDNHGMQVANRIHAELTRPFNVDGNDLFISASIGVTNAPEGSQDANDLLRDAETAMYHAKSQGRARTKLFNSTMHKIVTERIQLENDLKKALESKEFISYYQPIIAVATGTIAGFEALIRWDHPTQGIVAPNRFIPLAEETGLIIPMGEFMLATACVQAKRWQDKYPPHRDLTMSVNMSVAQMTQPSISDKISDIIKKTGVSPSTVKIEITESGLMNNVARASDLLNMLEKMGISLMIDDFGTGYSSLSHLHKFPFHFIKIDQSFVGTMEDKPDNMEIVNSIISLAHTLGKRVVAEGVETQSQLDILTELGCEFVQGYHFSRPLPASKAEELLKLNPQW